MRINWTKSIILSIVLIVGLNALDGLVASNIPQYYHIYHNIVNLIILGLVIGFVWRYRKIL